MQDSVSNRTSTSSLLLNDHLLREDINRRNPEKSVLMSRGQSMAVVVNHQEMENTDVINGQQEEVEEAVMEDEEEVVVMEMSCRFCGSPTGEEHVHFKLLHPVQV